MHPGHHSIRDLLWIKGLAVEEQLSIEFSWAPAIENCPNLGCSDVRVSEPQQIDDRLQVRCTGRNRSYIQITICQAIDSPPDTRSYGIIHRRVTHGARQTDRFQRSARVEEADDTENSFQLYQQQSNCRIIEIYRATLDGLDYRWRKRI